MSASLNRHRPVAQGFPDIVRQLGFPLDAQAGAELRALYIQLLVGFDLIAKGNTYPGYAMVYNEVLGQEELDLIAAGAERVVGAFKASHYYWRTAILEALSWARRRHTVVSSRLEWVGTVDPTLCHALLQIGRRSYSADCIVMAMHWQAEQEMGRALKTLPTEYLEDWRGDDREDNAQRLGETGS